MEVKMFVEEPTPMNEVSFYTEQNETCQSLLAEINKVEEAVGRGNKTRKGLVRLSTQMAAKLKECHSNALVNKDLLDSAAQVASEKSAKEAFKAWETTTAKIQEKLAEIQSKVDEQSPPQEPPADEQGRGVKRTAPTPSEAPQAISEQEQRGQSAPAEEERPGMLAGAARAMQVDQGKEVHIDMPGPPKVRGRGGAESSAVGAPHPAKRQRKMGHPVVRTAAGGGIPLLAGAANTGPQTILRYPYAAGVGTALNWAPAATLAGTIAYRAPGWTPKQLVMAGTVGLGVGALGAFLSGVAAPEVVAAAALGSALAAGEFFRPGTNQPPDEEQGGAPTVEKK